MHFIEPEVSLSCSQDPTTCPYAQPDESSPSNPVSLIYILILSSRLHPCLPSDSYLQIYPPKHCMHFFYLPYVTPASSPYLVLFGFITVIIFDQKHKSRTFSLCNVSPESRYYLPRRLKCPPRYDIPQHSQSVFFH